MSGTSEHTTEYRVRRNPYNDPVPTQHYPWWHSHTFLATLIAALLATGFLIGYVWANWDTPRVVLPSGCETTATATIRCEYQGDTP